MIELAVSAGVMVACLAGTVQFGYTFYIYNQLVTAVGNGGRYGAMRTLRAATPADIEKGKAAIRNMVVYGDSRPAPNALPQVANLKPAAGASGPCSWTNPGIPQSVNVSIIDYTVDAAFGMFRFTGKPAVEYPFVGRFAPAESEP